MLSGMPFLGVLGVAADSLRGNKAQLISAPPGRLSTSSFLGPDPGSPERAPRGRAPSADGPLLVALLARPGPPRCHGL